MNRLACPRVSWPREVATDQIAAAMRLLASTAGTPTVLEALGERGVVEHRLHVPDGRRPSVVNQLRATMPGIGIESVEPEWPTFSLALELGLNTRRRALDVDRHEHVARALLHALGQHGRDEALLLQMMLTDRLGPAVIPTKIESLPNESFVKAMLSAPFVTPGPADTETRSAMRDKQSAPGWRVIGRIAVRAASVSRSRQLAVSVVNALRLAEAPGVQIKARSIPISRITRIRGHGRLRLNVDELALASAWPVGQTADLPIVRLGSRRLPAPAVVPRAGRVIGLSTWPGKERPLAISTEDSLRHLHLLGPTGTGKSTLLLNLIVQEIAAGRGVVVVDPKRDLITEVLKRVPEKRRDDVVLLDPTGDEFVVGINPLAGDRSTADVRADQLLEVLHGLYVANWGPRTSDILGAALLTLARIPGMSLVSVPLLLTNPAFRRRIVGLVNDPLGLDGFWAGFEAWSEGERTTAIAPVLNKLRPFLVRPNLRRIVGQPVPKFRFEQVFTGRKIVLIDLAKGQIGAEAASLLGALVMAHLWQAIQSRSAVPAHRRHAVNVYLDEFQDYLSLPTNLADALAQARGLGVGFTLAHQHLGQLSPSMKQAVLANARSRVCFQLGWDDAKLVSGTSSVLGAEDFESLDTYHFYAQLVAGGQVQAWCSGRSTRPGEPVGDDEKIRRQAREHFGTPLDDIDAAIENVLGNASGNVSKNPSGTPNDIGPRRRTT